MQFAGSESWRFAVSVSQFPHLALFVRDALGLEVRRERGIPPTLAASFPDLSDRLDEGQRGQAGEDWLLWWASVVGLNFGGSAAARAGEAAVTEHGRRIVAVIDPPEWHSLAERPALRQAVVATFEDGFRFADEVRDRITAGRPNLFRPEVIGPTAERLANAAGVPVGKLDAEAEVVDVRGPWWVVLRRGQLLCSVEAARDAEIAYEALTAVFGSLL